MGGGDDDINSIFIVWEVNWFYLVWTTVFWGLYIFCHLVWCHRQFNNHSVYRKYNGNYDLIHWAFPGDTHTHNESIVLT